jgi:hypothetical protein
MFGESENQDHAAAYIDQQHYLGANIPQGLTQ